MSKILDLSVFGKETLDIKLPDDGQTLRIRKPTRDMVIKMMDFKFLKQNAKSEVIVARLDNMVGLILSSNDVDRQIGADYVENSLNTAMKQAIVTAYAAWISETENLPN